MLPGRTTDSPRRETTSATSESDEKDTPEKERAVVAPTPKLDLSFSIKLGQAGRGLLGKSAQRNTGARVDGSFNPSTNVGGSYGNTTLPEEESLMRTPALPEGTLEDGTYVADVKVSSVVIDTIRKYAEPQPLVPRPDGPEPPRSQPVGLGQMLGRTGGGLAGGAIGSALARQGQRTGGAAILPVAGGALAGAGLGTLGGQALEEKLQEVMAPSAAPAEGAIPEEQELQELLQKMEAQNPEFYQQLQAAQAPKREG